MTLPYPPELAPLVLTHPEDLQEISQIGSGAFGEVYKGKLNGEYVAIKKLRPILSNSADEVRFVREITIQATCQHPCILPLIGFYPSKTRPILVTKYVRDGSLEGILVKKPFKWTNTRLACRLYGVATALRDLHKRGFIHRDVKPANVLLGHPTPLLCDFGQARRDDKWDKATTGVGSMLFMAPDIMKSGDYTNKVDVYSFAVMAYVMIADVRDLPVSKEKVTPAFGETVSDGKKQITAMEFQDHIMNGGRFEPTGTIDDAWWQLITECWNHDPEKRPSFEDVCARIAKETDKFAMATGASSEGRPITAPLVRQRQKEFRDFVEDLNKKIEEWESTMASHGV